MLKGRGTSKVLQKLNLSQSSLCQNLLAKDIGDLLDGNTFIGLGVDCGTISGIKCQQGCTTTSPLSYVLFDVGSGVYQEDHWWVSGDGTERADDIDQPRERSGTKGAID